MALTSGHGSFDHPGLTHVDYKSLDMDRVLTAFLARLWHRGLPSRLSRAGDLDLSVFVDRVLEHPEVFRGFDQETTTRWTSTHLLDMVSRGRAGEAVAGTRPLHGLAYRFRNSRKSRPYGADEQLYEMLTFADTGALQELVGFFFSDVDRATGQITAGPDTDVETQALLHLVTKAYGEVEDRADESKPRKPHPPLCKESALLLAEDVMKLLYHRRHMPRTVLVDYLKVLFAFHLAIYHLRLIKLLPKAVVTGSMDPTCAEGHLQARNGGGTAYLCPNRVQLFVDVEGTPDTAAAVLAEHSVETWYRRIPAFVQATYTVKKLDEFAEHLVHKRNKLSYQPGRSFFTVAELLSLLGKSHKSARDSFFDAKLNSVMDQQDELPAEIRQIVDLKLDPLTEYVETLMYFKGHSRRGYIVECLDSLMLKNRPGALVAQPRGSGERRRFVLDARLLEVLLQVSLLRPGPDGNWRTDPMRVDDFLALLRNRYGLHIDRLPAGDGFAGAQLDDQVALRANSAAFLQRLREIGYYQDMSDAYLTQTITPRYAIGHNGSAELR
ncbi:hypothetical protein SAMN05192558_11463 [Actinokineospora alba]|uniref:Uncharacterized protein n=1 Tax=Actinokineospora alba TaxID=504798 RepID=A0A1H0VJN4_9PSEU|nr:hypothetical protein [Actinokineospora alba]TDP67697.1 hypothetical protein C8E96_3246 [Actinokineospora alba]SDJ28057.1 hypothetical protein SAMN05421871_11263 [Actinokineospora alba]SDP78276.1 hypothetical protein SAMN05192558_11463 [Actinokineospora alba]